MMNHNEKRGAETQHRGLSHTKNNVTDWIQLSCDTTRKMNAELGDRVWLRLPCG
ncbi:unnamed protein product, partial [Brassica rapa]